MQVLGYIAIILSFLAISIVLVISFVLVLQRLIGHAVDNIYWWKKDGEE
jgi:hypothetical protein